MPNYTRERVEQLLEMNWDPWRNYGPTNESARDGDMPGSKSNPSKSGTWMAELADLTRAWQMAPISRTVRRRVFMRYALGWSYREIATHEHVDRNRIPEQVEDAVGAITRWLNGEEEEEIANTDGVHEDQLRGM